MIRPERLVEIKRIHREKITKHLQSLGIKIEEISKEEAYKRINEGRQGRL